MWIIRWPIGRLILLLNFIFSPKSVERSKHKQSMLDELTLSLKLYQLPACPFCVKVRRTIKREGLNIELRNINQNQDYFDELVREGGKRTVPCLQITQDDNQVTWLYESSEINSYLQSFSAKID